MLENYCNATYCATQSGFKVNRKKIRGFSRHLRAHQLRAAASVAPIHFASLAERHYDYEMLGLAPWHVNKRPPYPIRRLWVAHLVAGFFSWQRSLQDYPEDYFLAVRIKEPDFADSRLTISIKGWKSRYEHGYNEPENVLPFPQEYRSIPEVNHLQWTTHRVMYRCTMEDFQDDRAMGMKFRHYWPFTDEDGAAMVMVQSGWEWVGWLPEAAGTAVALGS